MKFSDRPSVKPASLCAELIQVFSGYESNVLEVFSGSGNFSLEALQRGCSVTAIDKDREMVTVVERRLKSATVCTYC